jgi:transposase
LARHVRGADRGNRCHRNGGNRQLAHQSASVGWRRKRGAFAEAIGRSRGGRTTKLHVLTDAVGRPRVLLLAPGNLHDVTLAPELLRAAGPIERLIADKAYDTNNLRSLLAEQGIEPVIPSLSRRKQPIPYDPAAYRQRNLIERMFGRLKDFRRIATRYDKLKRNFLAGATIAAIVVWWI